MKTEKVFNHFDVKIVMTADEAAKLHALVGIVEVSNLGTLHGQLAQVLQGSGVARYETNHRPDLGPIRILNKGGCH